MCVPLLKSGRAHRECSRVRGKRIQVHPAKLGEAEKKSPLRGSLPLPLAPRRSPPTLCKLPPLSWRKQKTGSLCPAFKSTQSSVSSAPRARFPRPSPARARARLSSSAYLTSRLALSRSSAASSAISSPSFSPHGETTLLPLSAPSPVFSCRPQFFPYLYFLFHTLVYSHLYFNSR